MNEKEQLVLQTIKENPFLSQAEMAQVLNMSRPTLANIISGLIKKGQIVGRAYVLPEKNSIITIGGANVDRKFHIDGDVQYATSNPATVTESVGGVARNIAENLGRLGNEVKLITMLGQDQDGAAIKEKSSPFMSFDLVEIKPEHKSGSYSAVLNENGELILALANMSIYDLLMPSILKKHEAALFNAKCIIVDLNCPKETVEYLKTVAYKKDVPFIIVPVSSPKMKNMPNDLVGVSYFICNRDEAETYLKLTIENSADYEVVVEKLLAKGAKNVVLTLGSEGVVVGNQDGLKHVAAQKVEHVVDVTGAGDSFVSAVIHASLHDEPFFEAVKFAVDYAAKTIQSDQTVRLDITIDELENWRKSQ